MTPLNFTLALLLILGIAILISLPVFTKGLTRRGTGIVYESNFFIQRLPQIMAIVNIGILIIAFWQYNQLIIFPAPIAYLLSLNTLLQPDLANLITIIGLVILIHGLIFMIGGWYSLGNNFSTDSEILPNHKISQKGLLGIVMHPVYSGIIQSLFGAALIAVSPLSLVICLYPGAYLWLRRAKYEENLLTKEFGDEYIAYAKSLNWHRIIPNYGRKSS